MTICQPCGAGELLPPAGGRIIRGSKEPPRLTPPQRGARQAAPTTQRPTFKARPDDPPQQALYAGVDIGGTNIKLCLVDDSARVVGFDSIATRQEEGPKKAAERATESLRSLASQAGVPFESVPALGLASPGPMDLSAGMLLCPGNLPAWHDTPLRDLFATASGLPVTYANDANAAAYGEYWGGAGARYNSLVMITLGTGVGGGVIVNDDIIAGEHSAGAEIGHIIIDSSDTAPLNSLGVRGTLEGYCGSYGVVRQARVALADTFVETSLRDSVDSGEELTPLLIANAAQAGDPVALGVVLETARRLAIGLVSSVHMIDPEGVVLGGSLTFGGAGHPLGERFLAEVREQSRRRLFPSLRDKLPISFAELGGRAGAIGAAGLARRAKQRA